MFQQSFWLINTPDLLADSKVTATVTATDDAGNSKTVNTARPYVIDTNIDATITINKIAKDDIINEAESKETTTEISGEVGVDVKAGDTVTVSVNGKEYTTTVAVWKTE